MTMNFERVVRSLGNGLIGAAFVCLAIGQSVTPGYALDAGGVVVAQAGGLDPEIARKIRAIKKKADEAYAKAKSERGRTGGFDRGAADKAKREAREAASNARVDREARETTERARVERETKEAREASRVADEKRRRELEVTRLETEQKNSVEEKAARDKAEQERIAVVLRKRHEKRVADAQRETELRRAEEQRWMQAERKRIEKRRSELTAQRAKAERQADDARKADIARRARLAKDLEEHRKNARQRTRDAQERRRLEAARRADWKRAAKASQKQQSKERRGRDAMAAARRSEADKLSQRLARARANRSGLGGGSVAGAPDSIVENDRHVTILLIMNVGRSGVRRWSKTADPMLCIGDKCYLSQGHNKPARELLRSKAFGPGVALGTRGLACRSTPACIFRDVNLRRPSVSLQPVDLKFLRHDRRDARRIEADTSCTMESGRLFCDKLFGSRDWAAWVVPESIAQWAGPDALAAALKNRLQ